ncbi:hypothetical protein [Streptomyces coeruleorubidus]|uniref:hypothetical protein n=1 Tax=Streptomyces coeruleorubidus TaxID=116188 RepID=UPI0037BD79F0
MPPAAFSAGHTGFDRKAALFQGQFTMNKNNSLVEELGSRGVTVAATVTDVDTKPKCVKVRFVQGPERGTAVELSETAGMLPDAHAGESMLVTYDPTDPSRILARGWVMNLPLTCRRTAQRLSPPASFREQSP